MSLRIVLSFIISVAVAFGVIVIRQNMIPDEEPVAVAEEQVAPAVRVIVAARDVPQGNFIQEGDLEWKELGKDDTKDKDHLYDSNVQVTDFKGAVVRRMLRTGEPVSKTSMTKAGDGGFLSAVLEPGMRAVSIAVNEASGNAGFISPGDHVDLILAHRVRGRGTAPDAIASETIVSNCRVVAVDQMLDNPENKAILAKTVTVEVTPDQAARVAVASEMGKISIALRSLASGIDKNKPKDNNNFMRDSDISALVSGEGTRVQVIRGDQSESIDFSRGM